MLGHLLFLFIALNQPLIFYEFLNLLIIIAHWLCHWLCVKRHAGLVERVHPTRSWCLCDIFAYLGKEIIQYIEQLVIHSDHLLQKLIIKHLTQVFELQALHFLFICLRALLNRGFEQVDFLVWPLESTCNDIGSGLLSIFILGSVQSWETAPWRDSTSVF